MNMIILREYYGPYNLVTFSYYERPHSATRDTLRSVGCTTEHCQYALESVIRMNHLELNLNALHGTTLGSLAAAAACAGCHDLSRGWRSSLLGDRRSRSRYSIVSRARPPVASQRRRWLLRSLPRVELFPTRRSQKPLTIVSGHSDDVAACASL